MNFILDEQNITDSNIDNLSTNKLKQLCKQENIKGYSKKTKQQIINMLRDPNSQTNLNSNSDATRKARGFSYQRQYAIYIFLQTIFKPSNVTHIIEEGNFNGIVHEDITLLYNDIVTKTYQIKYHTQTMSFIRSNSDLFKTLKNVNNFGLECTSFIVSKNANTFSESMLNWINFSKLDKYNAIMQLQQDINDEVKSYRLCYDLYTTHDNDKILNYLDKFEMFEGFTYLELISNINNLISQIFNISLTDKKTIYYVKHMIFEIFDENWFGENSPLDIDKCKHSIEKSLNESQNIDNFNASNIIEDKINKYVSLIHNDECDLSQLGDILFHEINEIFELSPQDLNFDELLKILNSLHNLFLKCENDLIQITPTNKSKNVIKLLYNKVKKQLCKYITIEFKKCADVSNTEYDDFVTSISYYYKHDIINKINLNKSKIKNIISHK
jgi:hypothetical protein